MTTIFANKQGQDTWHKLKKVTSVMKNIEYNKELWNYASELAA